MYTSINKFMNKKIIFSLLIISLYVSVIPATIKAETLSSRAVVEATSKEDAEARAMLNRLYEIREKAKTKLSSSQKKELRNEVRAIKEKMKSTRPGVYLSIGAIIIIILLLILIF
jgi:hypothetical protein